MQPGLERRLRKQLSDAIKLRRPALVIEFIDTLWSKSISNELNETQTIKELYTDIVKSKSRDVTDASLITFVINVGTSRHIRIMLDMINDPTHEDAFDSYSKSKLLEWAISSNFAIGEILVFRDIQNDQIAAVKDWDEKLKFFSSKVCQLSRTQFNSITESIVPRILQQMDICAKRCSTDKRANVIARVLIEICKSMKQGDPGATYKPILVGSAAERTQAIFIEEFDYLISTSSKIPIYDIKERMEIVITKMTEHIYRPNLALKNIELIPMVHFHVCISYGWMTNFDERIFQ